MRDVAPVNRGDGKDDADIRRAELAVDNRAVSNIGAQPEVTLYQRRQLAPRGPRIERGSRKPVQRNAEVPVRGD